MKAADGSPGEIRSSHVAPDTPMIPTTSARPGMPSSPRSKPLGIAPLLASTPPPSAISTRGCPRIARPPPSVTRPPAAGRRHGRAWMANNPLSALRLALLKMSSAFGGGARRPPDISAALANPQWPAEWPFSAADFRRQDEVRAARLPLCFVCLAGCSFFFFCGPTDGEEHGLGVRAG